MSECVELRVDQVLASWAIFFGLVGLAWAVESFGWAETLVGLLGSAELLLLWTRRDRQGAGLARRSRRIAPSRSRLVDPATQQHRA